MDATATWGPPDPRGDTPGPREAHRKGVYGRCVCVCFCVCLSNYYFFFLRPTLHVNIYIYFYVGDDREYLMSEREIEG